MARAVEATLARREGLFDAQTNGYRCINGESDGWPGLVLDRYDRTFVLKLYTAAWLPRLDEVVAAFGQHCIRSGSFSVSAGIFSPSPKSIGTATTASFSR